MHVYLREKTNRELVRCSGIQKFCTNLIVRTAWTTVFITLHYYTLD